MGIKEYFNKNKLRNWQKARAKARRLCLGGAPFKYRNYRDLKVHYKRGSRAQPSNQFNFNSTRNIFFNSICMVEKNVED